MNNKIFSISFASGILWIVLGIAFIIYNIHIILYILSVFEIIFFVSTLALIYYEGEEKNEI